MKKETIFHIGLQKTGSKFLQYNVWPYLFPEESYLLDGKEKVRTASQEVIRYLEEDKNQIGKDGKRFISCEKISGKLKPNKPGESWEIFEEFLEALNSFSSRYENDIKIIIFLRKQEDWVKSAYLYTKKEGSSDSFPQYLNRFNEKDLSWQRRISTLWNQKYKLLLINWEDFLNSQEEIIEMIVNFLEVKVGNKEELYKNLARQNKRNISPKTKPALIYSNLKSRFRLFVNRVFFLKIQNRDWQDKEIEFLNKFGKSLNLVIPDYLLEFFKEDWSKTLKLIDENKHGKR
jgi:hypothetical protein